MSPQSNITITAAGAEGDTALLKVNTHQRLAQLLREALRELYGAPTPNPDEYEIVFDGITLDPSQTVVEAGLVDGSEIAVLPKDVSRG